MNLYKHRYSCIGLFAVLFTQAYTILGQSTSTCFVGGIVLSGSVATDAYNRSTGATATYSITSYTTGTCPKVTWSIRLNGSDTDVASYTFATSTPAYRPGFTNLNVSATSAGVTDQSVVTFQINQLSSNESGIIVFAVNAATNSASSPPLQILDCEPSTESGVIATVSSSPCGFGCTVQYSCASGYAGSDATATCQEDATFDAIPICAITCPNSDLPCSNPRYCFNETGSTNVTGVVTTQCNTSYSGSVSATCGNDGNWTITTQSPCPALCPVSDITSSPGRCITATGDTAEKLEGETVQVTCCNDYEGDSTTAICTSDRSWSNLPTCTKVTCSLSNLSSISNNVLQSNNSTLSVNETKVISCAAEYNGSGATASCSYNGTLTLTDTNCTKTPTPDPEGKSLSDGAIAGIVIGCLIVVAIIIVVLIAIFCAEICCCTFSILCLSWGTKD